jgi:hypothetical protein
MPRSVIDMSPDTKAAIAELRELNAAGKVFEGETGKLHENAELQTLLRKTYALLGKDIKRYAKITGPACIHNPMILNGSMRIVIFMVTLCTFRVGIYDDDTGQCEDFGRGWYSDCNEA